MIRLTLNAAKTICVATFLLLVPICLGADPVGPHKEIKDAVKDVVVKGPLAKMAGPSDCDVGQQIKLTSEGSVGVDIQFSVSPPTTGFEQVKLMDGKDTPGVIFTPSRVGIYYIYMMLNGEGKTAYTILIVNVKGPPAPAPDNPDETKRTFFQLRPAIKADMDGDAQTGQYLGTLLTLMDEWSTIADNTKVFSEFTATFRASAKKALEDGKLTETRRTIAAYMTSRFPKDPTTPVNKDLILAVKAEIVSTIKASR